MKVFRQIALLASAIAFLSQRSAAATFTFDDLTSGTPISTEYSSVGVVLSSFVEALRTPRVVLFLAAQQREGSQLQAGLDRIQARWGDEIQVVGLESLIRMDERATYSRT